MDVTSSVCKSGGSSARILCKIAQNTRHYGMPVNRTLMSAPGCSPDYISTITLSPLRSHTKPPILTLTINALESHSRTKQSHPPPLFMLEWSTPAIHTQAVHLLHNRISRGSTGRTAFSIFNTLVKHHQDNTDLALLD